MRGIEHMIALLDETAATGTEGIDLYQKLTPDQRAAFYFGFTVAALATSHALMALVRDDVQEFSRELLLEHLRDLGGTS